MDFSKIVHNGILPNSRAHSLPETHVRQTEHKNLGEGKQSSDTNLGIDRGGRMSAIMLLHLAGLNGDILGTLRQFV